MNFDSVRYSCFLPNPIFMPDDPSLSWSCFSISVSMFLNISALRDRVLSYISFIVSLIFFR